MSTTNNGQAQAGFGKLEAAAGDAIGDHEIEAKGRANQVEGGAKEAFGSAQKAIGDVADKARDAASDLRDHVEHTYSAAADKVHNVRNTVEPFVQERPYLALLAVFSLGFITSRILAPGGPKVVYVNPRN